MVEYSDSELIINMWCNKLRSHLVALTCDVKVLNTFKHRLKH